MRPEQNPDLCAGNLAFLSKQVAGQSHELINVFNVINELSGLLSDTLQGLATGRTVDPERLLALPGRIADQVKRGEGLVRLVNQFVHTADATWAVVDLREALSQAAGLVQRRARLCRSEVKMVLPPEGLVLETSPLGLLHGVVAALELVLEPLGHEPAQGGTLVLSGQAIGIGLEITVAHVEGKSLGPLSGGALGELVAVCASLGATVECRASSDGPLTPDRGLSPDALVLQFPRGLGLDGPRAVGENPT